MAEELSPAATVGSCSLIAYVRIAGQVEFREGQPFYFAEILDSAAGPPRDQLVLLANDSRYGDEPLSFKTGEQFIVFARRNPSGVYCPLPDKQGKWPVDEDGRLRSLPHPTWLPPQIARTSESAISYLQTEREKHGVRVTVKLNEQELRNYDQDRPLHVEVEVENTGEATLEMQNFIDYEFHTPRGEMMREASDEFAHPHVKIILQPLGQLHQLADWEQMMHQVRPMSLKPGERCAGRYDLAERKDIGAGGSFQLWAEVGGRRSDGITFELPESDGVEEAVKLIQAWEPDDDGPLYKSKGRRGGAHMPPVERALKSQIINAVLTDWCASKVGNSRPRDLRGVGSNEIDAKNVVLLAPGHVPMDFVPHVPNTLVVLAYPWMRGDAKSVKLNTSSGPAICSGVVLEFDSIQLDRQTATVRVQENRRHNLGGSSATYTLHRIDSQWQILKVPVRQVN